MAVGLVAVSTSGPLMAAIVAPALAVAMWRNVFALVSDRAGGPGHPAGRAARADES